MLLLNFIRIVSFYSDHYLILFRTVIAKQYFFSKTKKIFF